MIIAIMLTLLIGFLTTGCIKQITPETAQQKKLYEITTYDLSAKGKILLSYLMNDKTGKILWPYNSIQEFLKEIINEKANIPKLFVGIKEGLIKNTYYAKQIINYTDTEVRFIGAGSNKELFITADYITISQIR